MIIDRFIIITLVLNGNIYKGIVYKIYKVYSLQMVCSSSHLCFRMNYEFPEIVQVWLQHFDCLFIYFPLKLWVRTRLAWLDILERFKIDSRQILEFRVERTKHHVLSYLQRRL